MASRWSGRVALVTGASAGIGYAVTKQLAQLGMKVVGCSRNIEKIQQLSEECKTSDIPGCVYAIQCDVSKEDEILAMFVEIKEKYGGADVCINNAGIGKDSSLLEGETELWRQQMEVNVLGLCICTREAVKSMRERNVDDGHVFHLNRGSTHFYDATKFAVTALTEGLRQELREIKSHIRITVSGHRIIQGGSASTHFYAATKFAVTALTEGLRQELREIKSHIRITSISPALVKSEFASRLYNEEKAAEIYSKYQPLESDDIAEAIVYALQAPPHCQVHDILIRGTEQPY